MMERHLARMVTLAQRGRLSSEPAPPDPGMIPNGIRQRALKLMPYCVHGSIVFRCASCPNDYDAERNIWDMALHRARYRGWTARHQNDCFQNYCPRCSELAEMAVAA